MSIKKKQRILFHLILFTLFVLIIGGNFDYSAESTQSQGLVPQAMSDSHWVLSDSSNTLILNNTALRDSGHQLSYRIGRDRCQQSALQLRLNVSESMPETHTGQLVRLNVYLGEHRAMIYASVARVINTVDQPKQIELANFIINNQLQEDLKVNDEISFEVLEPAELAHAVGKAATFSLRDFNNSYALLRQLCEAVPVQKESSYKQLHAVL